MKNDFVKNSEHHSQEPVPRDIEVVKRLQVIYEQILAFERRYDGTFETLFGHQTDGIRETSDVTDWKKLVEERKRLIEELDRDDIPDGIYAVPRDPNAPRVKIRKLVEWCRVHDIPLSEIEHRPDIVSQFLVRPTKKDEQEN